MARYHDAFDDPDATDLPIDVGGAVIANSLETIARDGARRMLARFLEEEVEEFLGRPRYAPAGGGTGYRNGFAAEREIGIGTLSVPVRAPRVSDLPEGSEPFRSAILPRGRYLAEVTRSAFGCFARFGCFGGAGADHCGSGLTKQVGDASPSRG